MYVILSFLLSFFLVIVFLFCFVLFCFFFFLFFNEYHQLKHPGLVLYRETIVEYLNLVFGHSASSLIYWNTELYVDQSTSFHFNLLIALFPLLFFFYSSVKIEYMYEESLCHEKAEECTNLKEQVDLPALFACVRYVLVLNTSLFQVILFCFVLCVSSFIFYVFIYFFRRLTGMIFSPPCLFSDGKFFHRASPFQVCSRSPFFLNFADRLFFLFCFVLFCFLFR